jgi:hypothetical protein
MKKTVFLLSLLLFLSGCGGGANDPIFANVQIAIRDQQGNGTNGRALNVSGGGVSVTCNQSSISLTPEPQCGELSAGSGTNQNTPLIFTGLPTGVTYTVTEVAVNGSQPAPGNCQFTIIDSATLAPLYPDPECGLGDITQNQLFLTISLQ